MKSWCDSWLGMPTMLQVGRHLLHLPPFKDITNSSQSIFFFLTEPQNLSQHGDTESHFPMQLALQRKPVCYLGRSESQPEVPIYSSFPLLAILVCAIYQAWELQSISSSLQGSISSPKEAIKPSIVCLGLQELKFLKSLWLLCKYKVLLLAYFADERKISTKLEKLRIREVK